MQEILMQVQRLQRHYNNSLTTYDHVHFLDLSHTLRLWGELAAVLPEHYPEFSNKKNFKSSKPSKNFIEDIKDKQYVVSYLPCGVYTNIAAASDDNKDDIILPKTFTKNATFSMEVYRSEKYNIYSHFVAVDVFRSLNEETGKSFQKNLTDSIVKLHDYAVWLNSEIVRVVYKKDNGLYSQSITRGNIISRAGNFLDGSHSSLALTKEHKLDGSIKKLLEFKCGGLPLIYFLLASIAQDILQNLPKNMMPKK